MYKDPKARPVNLDLIGFKFPLNALLSIVHRVSGVLLTVFIIELMVGTSIGLLSASGFASVMEYFTNSLVKILHIFPILAITYHWLMGIRHLLEDYRLDGGVMHFVLLPVSSLFIYLLLSVYVVWRLL